MEFHHLNLNYMQIEDKENYIENIVRDILPEIEQDLKQQIRSKMETEMEQLLTTQQNKLQVQAENQFEEMMEMVQKEIDESVQTKLQELEKELAELEMMRVDIENKNRREALQKMQEHFLVHNFETDILVHPYFVQMEKSLQVQDRQKFEQKMEAEVVKKQKELLIKFKQRQDKEEQQFSKAFRNECQYRVEEERRELEKAKIEVGRLKSDCNIKLKKLQTEQKQYEKKYQEQSIQYQKYKQKLVTQLTSLLQQKQNKSKLRQQLEEQSSDNQKYYGNEVSDYQDQIPTQKVVPEKMISSSSSDDYEQERDDVPEMITPQQSVFSAPRRLLSFDAKSYMQSMMQSTEENYCSLNRPEPANKDLSKYLPQQKKPVTVSKSNFKTEYEKYLQAMSRKGTTKLSNTAKTIIINNFMRASKLKSVR